MTAAPSLLDLSLMKKIEKLAWKEKIQKYSVLEKQVPQMSEGELHEIQQCFLVMLEQTNVNILSQVLSLIKAYSTIYSLFKMPVEKLVSKIISFYNIPTLHIEDAIGVLCLKNDKVKILRAVAQGFNAKTAKKIAKSYFVLTSLIKKFGLQELLYLEGAIENISIGFFSIADQVKQSVFNLLKELYSRAGPCILHYARFMKYPLAQRLQQFANEFIVAAPFETFPERTLYKEFSFHAKYRQDFVDQIIYFKPKQLNECLKQIKQDSEKKNLKQENFVGILAVFIDLAKRRTPATSKLIVSILNNLAERLTSFQQYYSSILAQILFELVGCKQITQLLQVSQFLNHIKFDHIESKISHLSQNQAEYFKAIKLLKLLYQRLSNFQRESLFSYLDNLNMNYVYRLELEGIIKQYQLENNCD